MPPGHMTVTCMHINSYGFLNGVPIRFNLDEIHFGRGWGCVK